MQHQATKAGGGGATKAASSGSLSAATTAASNLRYNYNSQASYLRHDSQTPNLVCDSQAPNFIHTRGIRPSSITDLHQARALVRAPSMTL